MTSGAVSERLDRWLALIQPDRTVTASDYADFLALRPVWPQYGLMKLRYQQALASRTPESALQALCPRETLTVVQAFMRCAPYLRNATAQARRIWRDGADRESDASQILSTYATALTPADHLARFDREIRTRQFTAASRQIALLAPDQRQRAAARLALSARTPDADDKFEALPPSLQEDPDILLARLVQLRRAERLDEAVTLWKNRGFAIQARHPSKNWTGERLRLARTLLMQGAVGPAQDLAGDTTLPNGEAAAAEAHFLSGWIALRFSKRPDLAREAFLPLARQTSLLTKSRGFYWLGRSYAAAGEKARAEDAWREAATMPTTFYGQRALAILAGRKDSLISADGTIPGLVAALDRLPAPASGKVARDDLIEAASQLHARNDDGHARLFLMMAYARTQDIPGQAAIARLALRIGCLEPAVFASRRTGRLGQALYPEGWPVLDGAEAEGDGLPHGLALAVARQESSFNPDAVSGAHAIGLLQLQTGAAHDVARRAGLTGMDTSARGLKDPATNLILGRHYLAQLLARFGNVVPAVLSAYNAGPYRTDQWLETLPLPAPMSEDGLVDWIESLPYEETRSYIQRVEENMALYRVLENGAHG
ncbi:lytic transglycosylase domain-containing protein [Swaminathania salitolerans]|uniref:Lytic transglycosylase n=1 Tax=Swaminathania salitolerans TaxID=182838 RepID=A0A511BMZ1_9PROT|nr:lytic transglycosylase domain-containing protein [Swaminathania salitolerans]GBQ13929.1 murein transglycosylase [Swaminathania salitolerans LMG 21291]GEL01691.1 lytic transglycosylase [Swaminathania salitolerans]